MLHCIVKVKKQEKRTVYMWRQWVYGMSLYLLLNFAVKLNLL